MEQRNIFGNLMLEKTRISIILIQYSTWGSGGIVTDSRNIRNLIDIMKGFNGIIAEKKEICLLKRSNTKIPGIIYNNLNRRASHGTGN